MDKILLLILLPLSGTFLKAQNDIDSIFAIWKDETRTDSIRAIAFIQYIQNDVLVNHPDSAYVFAETLLSFGQEKQPPKIIAEVYLIQGQSLDYSGNYPEALNHYQRSLKIKKELGDKKGTMDLLTQIARLHYRQGNYSKALEYYHLNLELCKEIGNEQELADLLTHIGIVHYVQCNFLSAIDYYQRSLKIKEEIGDKHGIANSLHLFGQIYYEQHDYAQAKDYYYRGLKIQQEIGDKFGIAASLNSIGYTNTTQGNYSKALEYCLQSHELSVEIGFEICASSSLISLGNIYSIQGKYSIALNHYQRSIKIKEKIDDENGIGYALNSIGQVYFNQGKYYDAIQVCHKSLNIGEKLEMVDLQEEACSCLYKAFKNLGKDKKALRYYEQNIMLKDSLYLTETVLKLQQMMYDEQGLRDSIAKEKKEFMVRLAHEKEVFELEAKNDRIKTQRNGLIGGSLIIALLGFFGYHFFKIRKERNDKIAFAKALIFAQEEERKRIARDLHDGVGQSLLLIKKQLDSSQENTLDNQRLITDTLEEVRAISRDLHPLLLEKFGLTAAINETIEKIEKSTDLFITKEINNINKIVDDKTAINLFRTIQEAFTNIVKHSEATAAKINIQQTGKELLVNIQDNGKGFDHELSIITSKSLGLRTMFERITAIGGKMKIEKGVPKGTMILIRIPV